MAVNDKEILKIHLDHMRKSMDKLDFMSQQVTTLVEKCDNMKEDIQENKQSRIKHEKQIVSLKDNFKWIGRIFVGAQTIIVALASYFFKIDK